MIIEWSLNTFFKSKNGVVALIAQSLSKTFPKRESVQGY